MMVDDVLVGIREAILKTVPITAKITRIEFEGPEIAIYSANPAVLLEDDSIVKKIAKVIKKRIIVRSDPKIRLPQDRVKEIVKSLIPDEIDVGEIDFDEDFGEVIIEVDKPGLLVSKYGEVLKQIMAVTKWRPRVLRKLSKRPITIEWINKLMLDQSGERRKMLRSIGSRIHRPTIFRAGDIRITCLGGFREVGRSAILVETSESSVLLDCGVKTGVSYSINEFPRLDVSEFDIEKLDAVVISHAHLDHCGFLPFLFKYGYEGPVYCTRPTRDLMALLQIDYLEVTAKEGCLTPYSMRDVREALLHTIPLDYGEVTDIAPDIRLTFHNSGHILGSAMIHLHIGEGAHNLVYTSDFKFGKTRLLEPATYIFPRVETLIIESTYGAPSDILPQRIDAEHQLIEIISQTISRNGKVLIPVLSVGRAQEIMLVLNEAFTMKYLPEIPVYIEGMVQEATAIHMAYPENLSRTLREKMIHEGGNPFANELFKLVPPRANREEIIEGDPCIIIATSGMLTGGPALEYFKSMAPDTRNSIIFVAYQIAGTLGRRVVSGVKQIPIVNRYGKSEIIQVNLRVHSIQGFSGHSDRRQLLGFMKRITPKPEKVIICHGEEAKSINLAETFHQIFKINTYVPYLLETIRLK